MSTPGSFTLVNKNSGQEIPPSGSVDGGTLIQFTDPETGKVTTLFPFPVGDSIFELQVQAGFSTTVSRRPTWVQIELMRKKSDGTYDPTGKSRRSVVQPGTTTWADTFNILEFVNEDDGKFGWTITHNALDADIKLQTNIFKCKNEKANIIHKLGGFNMYSDGSIR